MSAEELADCAPSQGTRHPADPWAARLGAFLRHLAFGSLLLRYPGGGGRIYHGRFPGPSAELHCHRPLKLLLRIITRGEIGLPESYMAGDWSTPDLPALLELLWLNHEHLGAAPHGSIWSRAVNRLTHRLRANHKRNSRRNIARHYDLGNAFYRLWLDDGMTYSSAIFTDRKGESLGEAQDRKYQRLLDLIDAKPGAHILEIGCGWGGFAEAAARRGLRVTGVTLSREQLAHARERIRKAGLDDQVELRLQDYRDIEGRFDHAVSIEMLEAVGEAYWPVYFQALRRLVRPGGRIALQVITIHEDEFDNYRDCADFIQLYVFPGGMLPSQGRLAAECEAAGLIPLETSAFGLDYAETLRRWRHTFDRTGTEIARLGYDASFRRMWDYYLAYCEVGFETGNVDVVQTLLQVPGQ